MFGFFPGVAGVGVVGCVSRGGVAGLIVFLAMCFLLVTISLDPFPLCCTLSSLVPTLSWLGGKNPCVSPWLLLFQHVSSFGVG